MKKYNISVFLLMLAIVPSFVLAQTQQAQTTDPAEFVLNLNTIKSPFEPPDTIKTVLIQKVKDKELAERQKRGGGQAGPVKIVLPDVTVTGVVWDTNNPQAIINDTVVKVGETIEGMTILSISREMIEVEYMKLNFAIDAVTSKTIEEKKEGDENKEGLRPTPTKEQLQDPDFKVMTF